MSVQLGLFDAVKDLLLVSPVFCLGIVIIGGMLMVMLRKNRTAHKIRIVVLSLVFYYYLCVMLTHIVGIPTLRECMRLSGLGESLFHPNINLLPFRDGFRLDSVLNMVLFMPLGFLCPLISKRYQRVKNTLFTGFGLSLTIEIAQLFTLYRATDIDDLLTNTIGTLLGYLCFRLLHRLEIGKSHAAHKRREPREMRYVPVGIIGIVLLLGFFS